MLFLQLYVSSVTHVYNIQCKHLNLTSLHVINKILVLHYFYVNSYKYMIQNSLKPYNKHNSGNTDRGLHICTC